MIKKFRSLFLLNVMMVFLALTAGKTYASAVIVPVLNGVLVDTLSRQAITDLTGPMSWNPPPTATGPAGPVAINPGQFPNFQMYNLTAGTYNLTFNLQGHIVTYSLVIAVNSPYNYSALDIPVPIIKASAGAGGTIAPSGVFLIANGANQTYTIKANTGNSINQVLVDGRAVVLTLPPVTSYSYTFTNVTSAHTINVSFAQTAQVSFAYDPFGNLISVTDQRGNTLTKTYDAYDRLSQTKDPNGGITQFAYDTEGHLLTLTDANGHNTNYTYDGNGNVLTQTNPLNFSTSYVYDLAGNIQTRTDANNKATNYTYDALNRLTNTNYPDSTSVVNVYDAVGRKTSMTDTRGQTSYTYDAVGHLLTQTSPGVGNTITYTYDSEGNRLSSTDQSNRFVANTYDVLNRLSSVTDPKGTISYGYDAVSNKVSVTMPNNVVEQTTYDQLNRVLTTTNKTSSGSVISSFNNTYDIAGMIINKSFQDGTSITYGYDTINRLISESKQSSSSTVYTNLYTYDLVGNRLTWTKNTSLGNFWTIDAPSMPAQVLTNMTSSGFGQSANGNQPVSLVRNYTYDAANRLNSWNYTSNVNQIVFPIESDSYVYDNNGSRTFKQKIRKGEEATPQNTSYAYDFENRITSLGYTNIPGITGMQSDQLGYNGEGLRMQAIKNSVLESYLYDGFNIVVEKDTSGNTAKTYTRGLDASGGIGGILDQNYVVSGTPVTQYFDYNDLGSVANLTTTTGATASSYNFDAFGNLLTTQAGNDTNRYLFSTKELDKRSGLYYFGARYYDPEVGRWLTPDPLGMIDGPNIYAYAQNNPINLVDPYGLKVYIAEHPVWGIGEHWYIIIIPDNPQDFANNPLFYPIGNGQLETTISGEPGSTGNLTSVPNADSGSPTLDKTQINPACAERDTDFINNLLQAEAGYDNNLPYDPTPWQFDPTYNSNSFVTGILNEVGATVPGSPPGWRWAPGWDKPIPSGNTGSCSSRMCV